MEKFGIFLMRLGITAGVAAALMMVRSARFGVSWRDHATLWKFILVGAGCLAAVGVVLMIVTDSETNEQT